MKVVQTFLCDDANKNTGKQCYTTCWLPVDKRVKKGSIISLKGDTTKWRVVEQFMTLEIDQIQRKWNNNI